MKKLILTGIMVLIMAGVAGAEGVVFNGLNLNGDIIFLPLKDNKMALAVGTQIATIKDGLIELRAEYVPPVLQSGDPSRTYIGMGVGLNIRKAIEEAGGAWVLDKINSSAGAVALIDSEMSPTVGVYVTIVRVEF